MAVERKYRRRAKIVVINDSVLEQNNTMKY
jgi:hypothetical protein